ncbi:MAG: hypothetical protein L0H79_04675 [Intrasporangium sp.]|uniref:hypothetical protein n=1 Tax=Intrasporangium sp. TaxID=1925024 RepID=UPI0026479F00|nr:hypothetical protein [Intrasporangium sp.]MDN5795028.1 hypothetical protein [Intrasporangium sp.]
MAHFNVTRSAPVSAAQAWERVLDLRAHGEVIPFTTVRAAAGLTRGSRFVARTAVGRVGFDDPMVVEAFRPPLADVPGFARIRKEGRVIRGRIDLVITCPSAQAGCSSVTWIQEISVYGVPRLLDPIVAAGARAAYGWGLGRLLTRPLLRAIER